MQFYTYLHCKPDGTPFYVGKGCDHGHSRRSHIFAQRGPYHQRVVAKYGKGNIRVFVFYCESEAQAFSDEIRQIAQFRSDGLELTNRTAGGEGCSGRKVTDETKAKISLAHKNKKTKPVFSEETRRKISLSKKGRPSPTKGMTGIRIGFKHSPESREKISLSKKGVPWTEAQYKARKLTIERKKLCQLYKKI